MKNIILSAFVLLALGACNGKAKKTSTTEATSVTPQIEAVTNQFSEAEYAAFIGAAFQGDINVVKDYVAKGIDVNHTDPDQRTALLLASYNGHFEIVKLLIASGADVNKTDVTHSSALMFASSGPFVPTVKELISAGADLDCVDNNEHWNAIMWAAAEGQTEVLKVLVAAGADYTKVDIDGESAYDFAVANKHTEAAVYLKSLAQNKQ